VGVGVGGRGVAVGSGVGVTVGVSVGMKDCTTEHPVRSCTVTSTNTINEIEVIGDEESRRFILDNNILFYSFGSRIVCWF
jgi:hypothetical protein